MKNYKLVVLTNPREGLEVEYNRWYDRQHLRDLVAIPGIVAAQRFVLKDAMGFAHNHRYLAIYDIESDAPENVVAEMYQRRGTPAMIVSASLDLDTAVCGVFEPCSLIVKSRR